MTERIVAAALQYEGVTISPTGGADYAALEARLAEAEAALECALIREGNEKHSAKIAHQNMNVEINARELAEARAARIEAETIERCARVAEAVGNFGDYRRDELTKDFGQPRFDLMHEIAAAIRAMKKEG